MAHLEAVRLVRALAKQQHTAALSQLAARIGSVTSDAQFARVAGLIRDMIERLVKEAEADAQMKAYCDRELAETEEKKAGSSRRRSTR